MCLIALLAIGRDKLQIRVAGCSNMQAAPVEIWLGILFLLCSEKSESLKQKNITLVELINIPPVFGEL